MSKYRIVERNTDPNGQIRPYTWYYAQIRILGIWFDLRYYPFCDDSFDSCDHEYSTVEKWLQNYRKDKPKFQQKVVKTYE